MIFINLSSSKKKRFAKTWHGKRLGHIPRKKNFYDFSSFILLVIFLLLFSHFFNLLTLTFFSGVCVSACICPTTTFIFSLFSSSSSTTTSSTTKNIHIYTHSQKLKPGLWSSSSYFSLSLSFIFLYTYLMNLDNIKKCMSACSSSSFFFSCCVT